MNQLFVKSCEFMDESPDGAVALTVTAPPYRNAIDYDIHAKDNTLFYRTRSYSNGYSDYHDYLC
ncbi:MAG: hypothetical protein ACP5SI_04605 [Chloroflexia bacterium]